MGYIDEIKISVIVPVYNTDIKMLEKCLNSLYNQTLKEIEIVIVDDGSCDSTASFCENYAVEHDRFFYYKQNNSGVSVARNYGIDLSNGKYLMFVDSDDWIEENTLELLYQRASISKSDIILYDIYIDYKDRFIKSTLFDIDFREDLTIEDLQKRILYCKYNGLNVYGIVVGKMYRSSIIKENHIYFSIGISMSEDQLFALKVFQCAESVSLLDGNYYHYIIHNDSVSNSFMANFDYLELLKKIYSELLNFASENEKNESFYSYLYLKIFKVITVVTTKFIINENSNMSFNKQIEEFKLFIKHDIIKDVLKNVSISKLNTREFIIYILIKFHMFYALGFLIHLKQRKNSKLK